MAYSSSHRRTRATMIQRTEAKVKVAVLPAQTRLSLMQLGLLTLTLLSGVVVFNLLG